MNSAAGISFLPGGCTDLERKRRLGRAEDQDPVLLVDLDPALRGPARDGVGPANAEPLLALELDVSADVGIERPHRPGELGRVSRGIEAAVGRPDLLGVGREALVLL